MALLTRESGTKKRGREIPGKFHADYARTENQHVHVVVLHSLVRGVRVVAKAGSNAMDLVGSHAGAHPAPTDQDAPFRPSIEHGVSKRGGKIRIIVRMGGIVGSQIENVVASLPEFIRQKLLKIESRVICRDSDAHSKHLQVK